MKRKCLVSSNILGDGNVLYTLINYAKEEGADVVILGDILGNRGNSVDIVRQLLLYSGEESAVDIKVCLGDRDDMFLTFLFREYFEERVMELSELEGIDLFEWTVEDFIENRIPIKNDELREKLSDWIGGYLSGNDYTVLNDFYSEISEETLRKDYILPSTLLLGKIPYIVGYILEDEEYFEEIFYLSRVPKYFETENSIFVHAGIDNSLNDWRESDEYWLLWAKTDYIYDIRNNTGKSIYLGSVYNTEVVNCEKHRGFNGVVDLGANRYLISSSENSLDVVSAVIDKEGNIETVITIQRDGEVA